MRMSCLGDLAPRAEVQHSFTDATNNGGDGRKAVRKGIWGSPGDWGRSVTSFAGVRLLAGRISFGTITRVSERGRSGSRQK